MTSLKNSDLKEQNLNVLEGLPNQRSLVGRLVRSAIYWALPVLVLTSVALTWFYRASAYRLFDDPLSNAVTSLIASAEVKEVENEKTIRLVQEPIDPRYQRALSGRYWLIGTVDAIGVVSPIKSSHSLYGETLVLPNASITQLRSQPGDEIATQTIGPDHEPLRLVGRYVTLPNMEFMPVVVLAAADSRPASRAVRGFAALAIGFMIFLIAGLIIGVYTQVRLGLRPLFDLRERVADVREGRAIRVEGTFPQEIQPLATELNSLIDHNINVVERARTHVANLAHALKTPLAVLVNESDGRQESASDGLTEIINRQTDIMRKQVDHHLQRARAAARGHTIGVTTDVEPIISSLVRTLPRIYRSKDIEILSDIGTGLVFRGEKRDLDDMIGNLMDNACKWAVGAVRIRAKFDENDDAYMLITVEDDGPGLAEEDYKTVLQRGVRLDEATPGTGFGLAIVDDLARAYKGKLTLGQAEFGGLQVDLRLPCRRGHEE
ncbi:MAG: sensor histidine kinase [Maricaulaceae bacterium]